MYGICGITSYSGKQLIDKHIVKNMTQAMTHQEPGDEEIYLGWQITDGKFRVGLGHKKSSITDFSAQGHQPMCNENGTVWMVFNGEIHNFLELKNNLIKNGHKFKTNIDAEVVIHLYEELDKDCVNQLRGVFTFAIWDDKKKRLIVARDRLGVKPLYYYRDNKKVVFASEVKSILQVKGLERAVNRESLDSYISLGYVTGPETMFKNIYKLQPGHIMICNKESTLIEKYWDSNEIYWQMNTENYYINKLQALLENCVKINLKGDAPIGVLLSGGLDSSIITALLSKNFTGSIKTFSVVYDEKNISESKYARLVATHFNTKHYELKLTANKFFDLIPKAVWHLEEPVQEAAAICLYSLSKLASQYVNELFSGDGADELFAGYPVYKLMQIIELYRKLPNYLRNGLTEPLLSILGGVSTKWQKVAYWAKLPLDKRYLGVASESTATIKKKLYSTELWNSVQRKGLAEKLATHYNSVKMQDILTKMQYVDIKTWLPDSQLIKTGRMTMAAGVNLKSPFLDHKLLEFAMLIPPQLRIRKWTNKYILKKMALKHLPAEIVNRKKKGFPVPKSAWFRGELNSKVSEILKGEKFRSRGYFNNNFVTEIIKNHNEGRTDYSNLIYSLIVLETWHKLFIDSNSYNLPEEEKMSH